jgi:hypothetical protein
MMIVDTRPPTWHTALCVRCSRVHGLRSMTAMGGEPPFRCRSPSGAVAPAATSSLVTEPRLESPNRIFAPTLLQRLSY